MKLLLAVLALCPGCLAATPLFPEATLPSVKMGLLDNLASRPSPAQADSLFARPSGLEPVFHSRELPRLGGVYALDPKMAHDPQFNGDLKLVKALPARERLDPGILVPVPSATK